MPVPHDEPSRLADALDAFLDRHGAPSESDADYLARHPGLRDLLEPMLQGVPAGADEPRVIGPYRVGPELGRGGMGVVYQAEHAALHRVVALKVLPMLLAIAPRRIERFLREAAAVARLDHPGIVRVFDAGEVDGVFYYAMELVDGHSVREALDAVRARCGDEPRRLTDAPQMGSTAHTTRIDEIAALGAAIAEALAHAHGAGIVHRDVKPQNILLGADHAPRLVDFGLVKELDESAASVDFAGTPHYASPEQIDPTRYKLDGRSDVFSLGVVLYELAALRRPFEGTSTQSVLRAVSVDEPRSLRSFDPRIARDFEAVVLQALEKAPSARYASAAALAADLHRYLRREPVRARRHSLWRHTARWLVRHRLAATAAALAALLLIGGPLTALWFSTAARTAIGRERDAASANFAAARRSIQQLAARLTDRDLPDAPLLQRFRFGLLQDVRRGYDDLLHLAGDNASTVLLEEAARSRTSEAEALFDLGRTADAEQAFTHGITLHERVLATACDDPAPAILLAEALTGRGLARYVARANGHERSDFAAARLLWCDLEAHTHDAALRARVQRGIVRTELRLAAVMRFSQPEAAQEALARAQSTAIWRTPTTADEDLASELGLTIAELACVVGDLVTARAALERCAPWLQAASARNARSIRVRSLLARQHQVTAAAAATPQAAEAAARAAIAAREVLCREFPDVVDQRYNLLAARDHLASILLRDQRATEAATLAQESLLLAADLAAENGSRESLLHLALCLMNHAVAGSRTGVEERTVDDDFAEACRMLEYLITVAPEDLRFHSHLGGAASNRAQVILMRRGDPVSAAELLRHAVDAQRVAIAGAPRARSFRTFLESHLLLLTQACFRADDFGVGRAALTELQALLGDGSEHLITVAVALLICADHEQPDAIEAALATLRRVASGPRKHTLVALAGDQRFAALHADPRFVAIIDSAKGNQAKGAGR